LVLFPEQHMEYETSIWKYRINQIDSVSPDEPARLAAFNKWKEIFCFFSLIKITICQLLLNLPNHIMTGESWHIDSRRPCALSLISHLKKVATILREKLAAQRPIDRAPQNARGWRRCSGVRWLALVYEEIEEVSSSGVPYPLLVQKALFVYIPLYSISLCFIIMYAVSLESWWWSSSTWSSSS
jgi:hypothetical protein